MGTEGNKKPRAVAGAGFFGSLQVISYLPGHMPSARTSVNNEEYEYKGKKERAANRQQARNRRETVRFGGAAMVVALRHETDHTRVQNCASTVSCEINGNSSMGSRLEVWTANRPADGSDSCADRRVAAPSDIA